MSLITCLFVSHFSIACINSLVGSEEVECIDVGSVSLCVDADANVGCYQDVFKENIRNGEMTTYIVNELNEVCGTENE